MSHSTERVKDARTKFPAGSEATAIRQVTRELYLRRPLLEWAGFGGEDGYTPNPSNPFDPPWPWWRLDLSRLWLGHLYGDPDPMPFLARDRVEML